MTFGSFVAICLTLAFVLALLAVTMRLLRRFAVNGAGSRSGLKMEVVSRLALSPRQGIAVVRIGTQLVAVSVGEGGVRAVADLGAEDLEALDAAKAQPPSLSNGARDFRSALVTSLRNAGLRIGGAMLLVALSAFSASSARAQTQAPTQAPTQPAVQAPAAQQPAATSPTSPRAATTNAAAATQPKSAQQPTATSAGGNVQVPQTLDALSRAAPQLDLKLNGSKNDPNGLHLSGTVGVVVMMGLLTILPTLLLMMTSFTRILVVLNFLRQAIGAQASPPAHLVSALSLLLTLFVMTPTLTEMNRTALTPWLNGTMDQGQMMTTAVVPFREFMLKQVRESDLRAFVEMSRIEPPKSVEEVPTVVVMSAFVTSELRTAFQIGFALFLPFIVIDVVVSSVLMSMGMMMLPPAMIALPFKLLLFVLVDGWSLVIQSLVASFR